MTRCFLYIIFFLLSITISAQEDVFDRQNKEIIQRNKIKAYTQWNHAIKNGVAAAEGYKNGYYTFDDNGNLTELIIYKADGKVFSMESYKYDSIRDIMTGYVRYDGNRGQIVYKKAFRYDQNGNKLREVGFDGQSNYKNDYVYDANGNLTEIVYYIRDILFQRRKFVYSGNNRTINVYNNEEKFDFKIEQKFDAKGNIIEDIEYQPDGTEKMRYAYKYNASGDKIEEYMYEFGNLSYKKTYEYNGKKLVRITQYTPEGNQFDACKYEYNAQGLLAVEYFRKKSSQDFSTKTYTYNNMGICMEMESYYASYKYRVLFKFTYEYFDK